jgi:HPt (histidine-containing phosphotransfer) domain-containing protein
MNEFYADFENALQNLDGEFFLLKEVGLTTLKVMPLQLSSIQKAIAEKNPEELRIAAHNIKGSLSIYFNQRICKFAQQLESFGQENEIEKALAQFGEFEITVLSFLKALESYLEKTNKHVLDLGLSI